MDPNRLRLLINSCASEQGYSVPLSQLVQGIDIRFTLRHACGFTTSIFSSPTAQILRLRPDDSLVSQQDRVRDVLFHQDVRRPQDFSCLLPGTPRAAACSCAL